MLPGRQARAALTAAKDMPDAAEKTLTLRTWGANTLEGWLLWSVREGNVKDARHFLKLLSTRMSDLRTEEQLDVAAGMVEELEQRERWAPSSSAISPSLNHHLPALRVIVELTSRAVWSISGHATAVR